MKPQKFMGRLSLLLATIALPALGIASSPFVSVGKGTTTIDINTSSNGYRYSDSDEDSFTSLTIGSLRKEGRNYGFYSATQFPLATVRSFGFGSDWFVGNDVVIAYAGLNSGYSTLTWDSDMYIPGYGAVYLDGEVAGNLSFGGQVGVLANLGDRVQLEVGYRLISTYLETQIFVGTSRVDFYVDRIRSVGANLTYRF